MSSSRPRALPIPVVGIVLTAVLSMLGLVRPALTAAAPTNRNIVYDRSADGEWAVAGASRLDGFRGTAQVYRRSGTSWSLEATLAPTERGAFARFGSAVALSGNTLVIGAPWDDSWHGAAYVYERSGNTWKLTGRLAPTGAVGDRFGTLVESADGVVSLAAENGAVVRYRRTSAGWSESERVPAGGARLPLNRPVDAGLIEQTASLSTSSVSPELSSSVQLAPPTRVRAVSNNDFGFRVFEETAFNQHAIERGRVKMKKMSFVVAIIASAALAITACGKKTAPAAPAAPAAEPAAGSDMGSGDMGSSLPSLRVRLRLPA